MESVPCVTVGRCFVFRDQFESTSAGPSRTPPPPPRPAGGGEQDAGQTPSAGASDCGRCCGERSNTIRPHARVVAKPHTSTFDACGRILKISRHLRGSPGQRLSTTVKLAIGVRAVPVGPSTHSGWVPHMASCGFGSTMWHAQMVGTRRRI